MNRITETVVAGKGNAAVRDGPEFAVETIGLHKTYPIPGRPAGVEALNSVDLRIPRGAFFGLLGPNGAGKSTLINILAGLTVKTAGTARVWGYDIDRETRRARCAIGVVPQELNIDPFFTPRQLLEIQAGFYGVPRRKRRTDEILGVMGLEDKADAYSRTLSGGMQRRLLVGKAMVHTPPVLVLDEPTAGIDVALRQQLWTYLRGLNAHGTTVLLTTHYLEEAERLCDWIAIIDHGRVIACDTTRALLQRLDCKELTVVLDRDLSSVPETLAPFQPELADARTLLLRYRPSETRTEEILEALRAAGLSVVDLSTTETDLEDIFLDLTRGTHDPEGPA